MESVTRRHIQIRQDVGGELEPGSVIVFAFAFQVGDSVVSAGGELHLIFRAQVFEGFFNEKALVFVVVDDEKSVFGRFQFRPVFSDF